jgi:hypothetical protein
VSAFGRVDEEYRVVVEEGIHDSGTPSGIVLQAWALSTSDRMGDPNREPSWRFSARTIEIHTLIHPVPPGPATRSEPSAKAAVASMLGPSLEDLGVYSDSRPAV